MENDFKTCRNCKKEFKKQGKKIHCSRTCQVKFSRKKRYYFKNDDIIGKLIWRCEICDTARALDFDPHKDPDKLNEIVCKCGHKNKYGE